MSFVKNLRGILLVIVFLFVSFKSVEGQHLILKNATTNQTVFNASVSFHLTGKVIFSDEKGRVEIGNISAGEVLSISHPTFDLMLLRGPITKDLVVELTERIIEIAEVVISANKWKQNKREVPNEIVSISSKEIIFKNPQTAADMIGQTGQVFIQKSQMGGGSPMIRGFAANSVLIMMDGIRINNAIYRSGNLQNVIMLDPNLLSSSEVIFGPGSSVYGSDALGGVMIFQTLKPIFTNDKVMKVHGAVMTRYATANSEKTGHLQLKIQNKRISNITGFTYSDFGDLRSGSRRPSSFPDFGKRTEYVARTNGVDHVVINDDVNIQRSSGYHQYNLMNKLSFRLTDNSELSYMIYLTSSSDVPRYDRLIQRGNTGELKYAEWYYGPQNFRLNSLNYSNYTSNVFYDGLKVIVSNQKVEESRHDRKFQSDKLRSRTETVDVYALNIDLDKTISDKSSVFYGVEYVLNKVASEAESLDIMTGEISPEATRYPDGGSEYGSLSVYGSYKTVFNEMLVMTAGLRYSNVYLKSIFADTIFRKFPYREIEIENRAMSGTFGMVIHPVPNLKWSLLFSTGFRTPNVDDMGKVFDSEPGHVVVPNEALSPEYTFNYETGLNWKIGKKMTLDGSLYYTNLNDAMVRRPFSFNGDSSILYDGVNSEVEALVNVGEAFIWGYSFGLAAKFSDRFGFKGRVSNNFGEDTIEKVPLRHTNPMFGKLSLFYEDVKLKIELYSDFQGKRDLSDFAPSELNKPHLYTEDGSLAWLTINIRSSFQFSNVFGITAGLENILDTHYRPYSSGISASGINGILSLRGTF